MASRNRPALAAKGLRPSLAACLLAAAPARADDHGNSPAAATPISLGSTTPGSIETAGDNDYFRIAVPASGGTLNVATTGSTDTYGYLLDSAGAILAANDDFAGNTNFRISQSVGAATYYVRVRHYSGTGIGAYILVAQFTAPLRISTVAGTGVAGSSGDGGPATKAGFSQMCDVAVGPDGSLYISDSGDGRVRKVDAKGIITTAAKGYFAVQGMAVGPDGSLYLALAADDVIVRIRPGDAAAVVAGNRVRGFSGDGGVATAASLNRPTDVAVAPDGAVLIADYGNNRVRRVAP